ncbi:MAG: DNA N-glycosylase and apurinic/apyrimidinic (AP) lyase [Stictis urceolatum]|nr:DNA N-glycosylase and apurinic/apyrimidinic (AP) lyase [Stictis urceolata]
MRTSRISREAAKVAALSSTPRRQTRSQLAAQAPKAIPNGSHKSEKAPVRDADGTDSQSLSSTTSQDIEDDSFTPQSSRKRKRGTDTPSTTLTATSTTTTIRKSPRKIKGEVTEEYELDEKLNDRTRLPKARPQPSKKATDPDTGEVTIHPPGNWEEMYSIVQKMRKRLVAPVDTMGCERAADVQLSAKDQRFQTLIALMLSSQTKDTTNHAVMTRLRTELPSPGLTLTNILAVTPTRLNELIYAVGFHNNKVRYIKSTSEILRDNFDGDIPNTPEGLMSLPGVGPKMAYLCMSAAWDKTEGIGVDVHVHRITNLWGWNKTKGPEETRRELEGWLPREKWREINWLLVGLGQTVCTPVGRRCGECDLAGKGLCAGEVVDRKVKVVRKKEGKGEQVLVKEEDVKADGEKEVLVKEEESLEQAERDVGVKVEEP